MEFGIITNKIKEVLCNSPVDVVSVIEKLQACSAVKDKNVPLFDEEVFKNVTTVENLWQNLSRYWSIFDYNVLRILLRFVKCKRADDILEGYLLRVDISAIEDHTDLVHHYEVFERQGLIKPLLRVKIKAKIIHILLEERSRRSYAQNLICNNIHFILKASERVTLS